MAGSLILGGGFGGITVATELRRLLGEDHEITLVDHSEWFHMGLRKLWDLVGVGSLAEGSRPRAESTSRSGAGSSGSSAGAPCSPTASSMENARRKHEFEAVRLARWFAT